MTKILEEVRALSSDAIAKKQDNSKNNYPKLIEQIKKAAGLGKTVCEFMEHEIDEYSKKLLEADGFRVYITQKSPADLSGYAAFDNKLKSIWKVNW